VHDDGGKRAVRQDFHRMLIEGGQSLDACRRMVDLVEDNPEARKMADAMPPNVPTSQPMNPCSTELSSLAR
jgi:hypothetical protein